jgi:Lrp/AsnC family transcriptional regulator, leucine-responsive regulatory protein
MDEVDRKTVRFLMTQGRGTWAELGKLLHLTAPAAAERARKLEADGTILGYAAIVDPQKLGFPLTAFVAVTIGDQGKRAKFLRLAERHEQIVECHHVAGEDDYLLKVRCRGTEDLDRFLSKTLKDGDLGVARTRTSVVLGTAKETARLPTEAPKAPKE